MLNMVKSQLIFLLLRLLHGKGRSSQAYCFTSMHCIVCSVYSYMYSSHFRKCSRSSLCSMQDYCLRPWDEVRLLWFPNHSFQKREVPWILAIRTDWCMQKIFIPHTICCIHIYITCVCYREDKTGSWHAYRLFGLSWKMTDTIERGL